VLLATHIASDIECIADKVVLLKKGKVIQNTSPFVLMEQVQRHIREVHIRREELEAYQEQYKISNCIQKKDGLVLHILTEEEQAPVGGSLSEAMLDDVYLYYFEVCKN